MSKSPWGNIGAWAADAEREEAEQAAAQAAAPSFPSLKEAVSTKPKKKTTKMTLQELHNSGGTRLTHDEMLRLPTGPKERSTEEMYGFSNYGSRGMGTGRARDSEEGPWGNNRRPYGGGFGDDERRGPPNRGGSDFDQPSRADEVDNWASTKKIHQFSDRNNRYGSLGAGAVGGVSRADGDDNWGASKKPIVAAPPPPQQQARSWFPDSRPGPEPERWTRPENVVTKVEKANPFGAARPREEVLAEKGLDWKKLDMEIEVKKGSGSSRPTSSHSSRPGSSHSARSEGPKDMADGAKAKPKVNPFGDAKPREVLLEEKGLDWRKIDLELEHRSVDRPESEEEKNLKEEIEQLRKEAALSSTEDQINLQNVISQKERDLELLIRDLDDKVRFTQKPIQRPGSGSGRGGGPSDRSFSQPVSYEDRRAGEQMDRPRSRGGVDARARPTDPMERPRSRGGVDGWARPNEQVERPRSRGGGDAWPRPTDERRSFQGGRGGFFGSRELDRTKSRDRW